MPHIDRLGVIVFGLSVCPFVLLFVRKIVGCIGFNATLTAKVISW